MIVTRAELTSSQQRPDATNGPRRGSSPCERNQSWQTSTGTTPRTSDHIRGGGIRTRGPLWNVAGS